MNDIDHDSPERALLGRAITGEPAMRDSPESVLRMARRRSVLRLGGATAATVVGVVGVVVGATVLAGNPSVGMSPAGPPSAAPAMTPAPATAPGWDPKLPAVSRVGRPTSGSPSTDCPPGFIPVPSDPGSACRAVEPLFQEHADALTAEVAAVIDGLLPPGATLATVPGSSGAPLKFGLYHDRYVAVADVVDGNGRGSMSLSVSKGEPNPQLPVGCAYGEQKGAGADRLECVDRQLPNGMTLAVERYKFGEVLQTAVTGLSADGTWLYLYSTTASGGPLDWNGDLPLGTPTRTAPPLDGATLFQLASLPGLTFG